MLKLKDFLALSRNNGLENKNEENMDKWWWPLYEFGIHAIVGTFTFIVVAVPAVGLSFLISYLEDIKINSMIVMGLTLAEYVLFAADLALFVVFMLRSVFITGKKLWNR